MIIYNGISVLLYGTDSYHHIIDLLIIINMITNVSILPILPTKHILINYMKTHKLWLHNAPDLIQDPKLWGPLIWGLLYHLAYMEPSCRLFAAFILKFYHVIPCGSCKDHFREILHHLPELYHRPPVEQVDLLRQLVEYKKKQKPTSSYT
jgi:hypothetical protein